MAQWDDPHPASTFDISLDSPSLTTSDDAIHTFPCKDSGKSTCVYGLALDSHKIE